MYELIELLEAQPMARKINMQFKNIKDLTPLVGVLVKFKALAEISFHGNKMTTIPSLQTLKNLRAIDLSNNPIKIDKFFLDRLHQVPNLEQLFLDCSRDQKQTIIENIPNLKHLNGEPIFREKYIRQTLEEELKMLESKLTDEMKKMKETYSRLALSVQSPDQQQGRGKSSKRARDQQFTLIYRDIQQEMNYFYSGLQDKLSRQGVYAYCKNKMTVILDNLMIKILDQNASEAVVKMYEEVSKIKSQNFDLLLRIIFNASYERHVSQEADKPTNRLRKETIYQNQIFRLKKEITEIKKEQGRIQQISQKERTLKEKSIKPQLTKSPTNPKNFQRSSSVSKLAKRSPSAKVLTRSPTLTRSPSAKSSYKPTYNNPKVQNTSSYANRAPATSKTAKNLTLDQLIKIIEQIMAEKRKYNLRSLTKNEVFETAEEFIFTFFTRKYGLKEVALQWSLSLIKAIELFCRESIQVQIFGKILKNQLYEEYYDQFKSFAKEIDKVYKELKSDRPSIQQSFFRKVFFYFFSYEDEETFHKIVKTFTFPISQAEHTYFLQSYKLAFEEKHMANFLQLFYSLDSNDDSALSVKESKELICALIKTNKQLDDQSVKAKMDEFSAVIDTFKKNKFIFSELFQIVHPLL